MKQTIYELFAVPRYDEEGQHVLVVAVPSTLMKRLRKLPFNTFFPKIPWKKDRFFDLEFQDRTLDAAIFPRCKYFDDLFREEDWDDDQLDAWYIEAPSQCDPITGVPNLDVLQRLMMLAGDVPSLGWCGEAYVASCTLSPDESLWVRVHCTRDNNMYHDDDVCISL